jgi:tRNA1(Val) A37 N6-methylase TrmN6
VSGFDDEDLSCDGFLGGRVRLWQPRRGYRAGIDPVLLAAAVPARPGQSVLDLGCGAGAAALCLAARVPGLRLTGIEIQPAYAELARRNVALNGADMAVICADLTDLPAPVRQERFDHVLANPPYFAAGAHSAARDGGRARALGEVTPLAGWIAIAARRLAPGGHLHMIQRTRRLPEMLAACEARLGSLEVLPLAARAGRGPELAILRARKGGRAGFVLHAPTVLHAGSNHARDGDDYLPEISAVLRVSAALAWPGQ